MLQNEQGSNLTPAFVSFTPEGAILIGDAAKSQARALQAAVIPEPRGLPNPSLFSQQHHLLEHT